MDPRGPAEKTKPALKPPTEEQIASWYPRLYRTALRLTGSAEQAADLTQEAFCRALDGWDGFNGEALPTTWLHCILLNCVRDCDRRRKVRSGEPLNEWSLAVVTDRPAEQLEKREQLDRLRQVIEELPAALRPAFVATVLDGCTYQEAGELLSVPAGTIASRVHEARKKLSAAMQEAFPEA